MTNWKDLWEDIELEVECFWDKVRDFFNNICYFFINIHIFRKDLWNFRPWDHEYCKDIYCTALEVLKEELYRNGHEVDESRFKKVSDMEELLRLLNIDMFDVLYDNHLLKDIHNKKERNKINKLYNDGEKSRTKRIFELLKESGGWWD